MSNDEGRPRTVAAFDFDGTLTAYDTLIPFLVRLRGVRATAAALALAAPRARSRADAKAAVIGRLLGGLYAAAIAAAGEDYADHLVRSRVRPTMRRVLDDHRSRGHTLVLVSASLELYLSAVGRELGFDAILATRLEVGADGRLTGRLAGANVRGEEKARLLRAWLGAGSDHLYVYGDSSGDHAMLAMAHQAVRVKRGRPKAGQSQLGD